jgi:hypothetical protein
MSDSCIRMSKKKNLFHDELFLKTETYVSNERHEKFILKPILICFRKAN